MGAGMAGLSVALELIERGHDVQILEARTWPGGRVLTIREPFTDGLYAEAGAMQVIDTHTRVLRYLQRFGIDIDPIQPSASGSVLHVMGRRVEVMPGDAVAWPFDLHETERSLDARSLWERYVVPELHGILEAEAQGRLAASFPHYERITFADFLRSRGASSAAIAILSVGLPSGLGDGASHVSALNLLREAAHRHRRKQSFTIRGGTDRLPRALAKLLADRVHYGTPVVRLEQDGTQARAIAMQGGALRAFVGDRIVCTLPFSVLRGLEIRPAFSREKRAAIEQLPYTSVARIFVQTRRRFWIEQGLSGNAATDLPVMGIYERTLNQPGSRGILEAYVAGADARRMTALDKSGRLATTLDGMAEVYPRIREQYEGGASKCWDNDPWSRGAYAWFKHGQMSLLLPHIARVEGRIHFAGEHASSDPGWMEGALDSGERVIREFEAFPRS